MTGFPSGGRVHFVGIGGAGMSAIAQVLLRDGFRVSGSDLRENEATRRLRDLGAAVAIGHDPAHVADADAVVVSRAIPETNPELAAARRSGRPIYHRAQALAALMANARGIAIAGTHGKTSTAAMTAHVLIECGLDPTVLVGAEVRDLGGNARGGRGRHVVAEVDESDGSLLHVAPWAAVITSLDATDHMDHYRTLEMVEGTFAAFLRSRRPDGFTLLCADHPGALRLAGTGPAPEHTYGLAPDARYRAERIVLAGTRTEFVAVRAGERLGEVTMNVIGRHNVQNGLAALAVGLELGVEFGAAAAALGRYRGVSRRFDVRGEVAGVTVVDDYAHNPVKVATALAAARESWPARRIVAVFQPHRYTRTRSIGSQFGPAFACADLVLITDIYPADEAPVAGVTAGLIVDAVRAHRPVEYVADPAAVPARLLPELRPGDLVVTLGAGDVWRVAEDLVARLRDERGDGDRGAGNG